MSLGIALGWLAAGLTFAAFLMKSMAPLRTVAVASNVAFIAYAYVDALLPIAVLHAVLLPLNVRRLMQIRRLVRDVEGATVQSPLAEWLVPHMTRRVVPAGTTLFSKGDVAGEMFYVQRGDVCIPEYGDVLGPGTLIGEIGMFTPERRRTQSVVCDTECELYSLSQEGVARLYFQNPKLGIDLMRLIVSRLLRDVETATAEARSIVPASSRV